MAPLPLYHRGRSSTGHYRPSPLEPSQGLPPDKYLPSNMSPYSGLPPASYPPSSLDPDPLVNTVRPEAPVGGGRAPTPNYVRPEPPVRTPIYEPGGGEVTPPVYEPGGSNVDYPLPPSRPSGLGQVLSSAVRGNAPAPLPPARPQAQPQLQAPSPFTITAPNSDPLARNRPQMGALDLSGLFGGLFGRGGGAPAAPAPSASQAPAPARAALRAPDGSNWTVDSDGNPIPDYGSAGFGLQPQNPAQLASTVGRADWWKSLR